MLLKFINAEGRQVIIHLSARPSVTIGRSQEADVCIAAPKSSRLHCEIRQWDGDYVLKDLGSRNGTYINNERVRVAILKAGDTIRIGATLIGVEKEPEKGSQTVLAEITQEMEEGHKGYRTILREISQATEQKPESK